MKQIFNINDLVGKKIIKTTYLCNRNDYISFLFEDGSFCLLEADEEYGELLILISENEPTLFEQNQIGLLSDDEYRF